MSAGAGLHRAQAEIRALGGFGGLVDQDFRRASGDRAAIPCAVLRPRRICPPVKPIPILYGNARIVLLLPAAHFGEQRVDQRAVRSHRRFEIGVRSEEHTSELQSLMRNSYAVFCLKKKKEPYKTTTKQNTY